MNKVLFVSILAFVLVSALSINVNNSIYAHTFSGDESASFLTTVEMIKIESQLAQKELASNVTPAKEHAEHTTEHITANDTKEISERNLRLATELNKTLSDFTSTFESKAPSQSDVNDKVSNLNDVLSEVVSARIEKGQLNNVTVKALVLNDLIGESLEHCGSALGIAENSHDEYSHDENTKSVSNSTEGKTEPTKVKNNETASIVNEADYQIAQAAVFRALDIYKEIKPNSNANSTEFGDALNSLKGKIDNKSPFDDIDKVVDEKITPLLNDIFTLGLSKEEEEG